MEKSVSCEHVAVKQHLKDGSTVTIGWVHISDSCMVEKWRWSLDVSTGYIRRTKDGMYLHRFVMGLGRRSKTRYQVVDHINRQRNLNCRVCNLRICSASENSRNRRSNWQELKTSKYKGVSYQWGRKHRALSRPWRARIRVETAIIELGRFANERSAAIAYNEAAERYHGPYMVPNVIPPEEVIEELIDLAQQARDRADKEEREYWQTRIAEEEAYEASSFLFDPYSHIDHAVWTAQSQEAA